MPAHYLCRQPFSSLAHSRLCQLLSPNRTGRGKAYPELKPISETLAGIPLRVRAAPWGCSKQKAILF
jgi:hypothetical protein